MDLSNAKIIAWEGAGGRTFVGVRQQRGERFRTTNGLHEELTEDAAARLGARTVTMLPAMTPEERLGGATEFRCNGWRGERYLAYKADVTNDFWVLVHRWNGNLIDAGSLKDIFSRIAPASVTPLFPREVVS